MRQIICSRIVVLIALLAIPQLVLAQAKSKPAKSAPAPAQVEKQIQVFYLKYADAEDAADMVSSLVAGGNDFRLTANARTNSLIMSAGKKELQLVQSLLLELDKAPGKSDGQKQIAVHFLESDARDIEKSLRLILDRDIRLTVDRSKNSVITFGTKTQLANVESAIRQLDTPPTPARPAPPLKLRVIWLMSGGRAGSKPLTDDLKPIAASLAKIGIDDLGMVTQTLINVSEPDSGFSALGSIGDEEWTFEISGTRQGDGLKPARLDLSIDAVARKNIPIEIKAVVTLAPKQLAVLGVTQTGTANSVFVVQLVEGL